ncbi:MAG: NAD(P)-dependent oxidoreductase [SAR324 cluster bacterium]|nr:NAD(P)-dependent oxidoreductase [SAR324 cluster bacterium]
MARVLLTGSSGFIGKAVALRLIQAGHDVLGVDPIRDERTTIDYVADDLSSIDRLRRILTDFRPTHVIHTGGVSGPMVISDQPARIMAINVTGSLNLLQACLDCGAGVFVHCSSISAIGEYYEPEPIDEHYPMRPVNPYGYSKAAVDMVLRGLWGKIPMEVCSLRFTSVYGPGRQTSHSIHAIIEAARSGQPVTVQGATDSPYVYIDDAADAAVAACFSENRRQLAYFIAHPEMVSVEDIVSAVEGVTGPIAWEIDPTLPHVRRGPLDVVSAARDFDFTAKVNHQEGIRRILASAG